MFKGPEVQKLQEHFAVIAQSHGYRCFSYEELCGLVIAPPMTSTLSLASLPVKHPIVGTALLTNLFTHVHELVLLRSQITISRRNAQRRAH